MNFTSNAFLFVVASIGILLAIYVYWIHRPNRYNDNITEPKMLNYDITMKRGRALTVTFTPERGTDGPAFNVAIYFTKHPGVNDIMHVTALSDVHNYSFYLGNPEIHEGVIPRIVSLILSKIDNDDLSYLNGCREREFSIMLDLFDASNLHRFENSPYSRALTQKLVEVYTELKYQMPTGDSEKTNYIRSVNHA